MPLQKLIGGGGGDTKMCLSYETVCPCENCLNRLKGQGHAVIDLDFERA